MPAIRPRAGTRSSVGLIGAGTFASGTLIPAMKKTGFTDFAAIGSASGLSATRLARDAGFQRVVRGGSEVIADMGVGLVVIATRHDSHEEFTLAALEADKHVFCEKPLALTFEGLERIAAAWHMSAGHLMVGFNRRHAPAIAAVRRHIGESGGPLVITYRVNAGRLPPHHWYVDRRQGGRLHRRGLSLRRHVRVPRRPPCEGRLLCGVSAGRGATRSGSHCHAALCGRLRGHDLLRERRRSHDLKGARRGSGTWSLRAGG